MAKFTFVFDEETTRTLRATAARLHKSQSLVVREAVAEYAAHAGRLTDSERRRMLTTIDAASPVSLAKCRSRKGRDSRSPQGAS
jgi:predicted transcriptional regulator